MQRKERGEQGDYQLLFDMMKKGLIITGLVLAVYIIIYVLAVDTLHEWGLWLSGSFGYGGLVLFTFVVDTFILPTSVDVIFPLVIGWSPLPLILVMSTGSAAGGFTGYWIARSFNRLPAVHRAVEKYREKNERLIDSYGAWAVAIAGFTPIPFSTICWTSGLMQVPPARVALACLSRFPRMAMYYLAISGGISLFI